MEPENKPPEKQTPMDVAFEKMLDAWDTAGEAWNIWQYSMALDQKKDTEVTTAAVDAALDDWLEAKANAIGAEIEYDQICDAENHADTCKDCQERLKAEQAKIEEQKAN